MKAENTRDTIKLAARRLFAAHGVDGVSVREIVAATGQKNGGSLHYYFRSKDALVRELIVDGAKLIEDRRNAALDAMEAAGGPQAIRQALEVLVWPATSLGEGAGEEDTYLRFISFLGLQQRQLLQEVLGGQWNGGYQRCLAHIRRLATAVPKDVLEQRLVFMSISLRAIMAAREAALEGRREHGRFWTAPPTMENLLDSLENMLCGPVSQVTAALVAQAPAPALGDGTDGADPAGVQLADEIAGQIRARNLEPGVLVASEQELRSRHDIGRSVLRQAVRILEERGVAFMRRGAGGGLIVAPLDPDSASRSLAIVIESRMQGPNALDLLLKATDTHVFLSATPRLDMAACERIRRLALRLSALSNADFQRQGGLQQMVMAVRGLVREPLAGLAYQTTAEYGQDLAPYSVLMEDQAFRGAWWDAMLQMVEAQIAGDVATLFDMRRRQLDMVAESQRAWSAIDRDSRLVPAIEEAGEIEAAPGQGPADRFAREILRDVRLLGWAAGERIGGAAELMARYQVTVGTLRQGVRILEEHNAVRMERGRSGGLFVTMPDAAAAVQRARQYLTRAVVDPRDVLSFQRQLSLEALSRVAAGRPALARLQAQVATAPDLHRLLGELSGDAALALFCDLLAPPAPGIGAKVDQRDLQGMAAALADGDGPKARRAFLNAATSQPG